MQVGKAQQTERIDVRLCIRQLRFKRTPHRAQLTRSSLEAAERNQNGENVLKNARHGPAKTKKVTGRRRWTLDCLLPDFLHSLRPFTAYRSCNKHRGGRYAAGLGPCEVVLEPQRVLVMDGRQW
jgi:hypothetical protein